MFPFFFQFFHFSENHDFVPLEDKTFIIVITSQFFYRFLTSYKVKLFWLDPILLLNANSVILLSVSRS